MTKIKPRRFFIPHPGWMMLATALMVVISVGLMVWLPYQRAQRFVQEVERLGGWALTEPGGPEWLLKLLPEENLQVFEKIVAIDLRSAGGEEAGISLDIGRGLIIPGIAVTPGNSPIDDEWLRRLGDLTELRSLNLENTSITDPGLAHLKTLNNLQFLSLQSMHITDDGLHHLKGLTTLEELTLFDTKVTRQGMHKLRKTLPKCDVHQEWFRKYPFFAGEGFF